MLIPESPFCQSVPGWTPPPGSLPGLPRAGQPQHCHLVKDHLPICLPDSPRGVYLSEPSVAQARGVGAVIAWLAEGLGYSSGESPSAARPRAPSPPAFCTNFSLGRWTWMGVGATDSSQWPSEEGLGAWRLRPHRHHGVSSPGGSCPAGDPGVRQGPPLLTSIWVHASQQTGAPLLPALPPPPLHGAKNPPEG